MSNSVEKAFISYRHVEPDSSIARELAAYLRENGIDAFIDMYIRPGVNWQTEIGRELTSAKYFVVLLSSASVMSGMVLEEVRMAGSMSRGGKTRILPVWIGEENELPYPFAAVLGDIQALRFRNEDVGQLGKDLIESIRGGQPVQRPAGEQPHPAEGPRIPRDTAAPAGDPGLVLGGATILDSPYYIRRQADIELDRALAQPTGQTILIAGPKQSGKSSLLARAYEMSRREGDLAFYLDFQSIDGAQLESLASFLRALGRRIESGMGPNQTFARHWDTELGAIASLTSFLKREALSAPGRKVAICFDEVDRIFSRTWAEDFFSMIRSWHNLRAFEAEGRRLTLILTHATDPGLWIHNNAQSPFNVGIRLRLDDFSASQVAELARRYSVPMEEDAIKQLFHLTGGQPYLARLALWEMKQKGMSAGELERIALDLNGPFSDHLNTQLAMLERNELAMQGLREVIERGTCDDELSFEWLRWAGLVTGPSRRNGRIRCELYRLFFSRHFEMAAQFA